MCKIRKELRENIEFNPFNPKYNKEKVFSNLEKVKNSAVGDDTDALLIAAATPVFNSIFKNFYTFLDKAICDIDLTYDEMRKYIIAIANRDIIVVGHKFENYFESKEGFDFSEINHFRVNSGDPSSDKINASAAVVTTIDSAITFLNFLRNREERLSKGTCNEVLNKMAISYSFAGYYYVIKDAYDIAVWENCRVVFDAKKDLHIRYHDSVYPKLKNIGLIRLQQNVLSFELLGYSLLQKDTSLQKVFKVSRSKKIKSRGIKNLKIINGEIELSIKKCEISIEHSDIINKAAMLVYYPFFEDIQLKKLGSMTLDDILVLFNQLQQLVIRIKKESEEKVEVENVADLENFAYRTPVETIRNYLHETTNLSNNQINHFLKVVESCNGSKRIDLWSRPLFKVGIYYFLPLVPIISPNILYLIDVWLDEGGYDLKERGKLFERYIKNLVKKSLDGRFTYVIPNKSKFFINESVYEEIDFLLVLKDVVLVAEVKCVKYPFGPRDYYNSIKRLTEGADQVIRKTKFLKVNAEKFVADIGIMKDKEFIPVVITNYPSFSGLKIKDIPVIDFFLLDGYINSGKLGQIKVECTEENQINLFENTKKVYYDNEEEFNQNLKEYIMHPAPVEEVLNKLSLGYTRITLEGDRPQIFMQEVIMK